MIKIENEQFANYLMFKLDKEENQFTEEELKNIDEIVLDTVDINDNYYEIDLNIMQYFTGVKKILLKNIYFSNDDIQIFNSLKLLKALYFEKCSFEDVDLISKLKIKDLELINCEIIDYSFLYKMNELNSLSIINGTISVIGINNLKKLKYLQLSYSNIFEIVDFSLPEIEEIYIDNTNIDDISIIKNINTLKRVGISKKQYIDNNKYVEVLVNNGVVVTNENIVEFNVGGKIDE